MRRTLVEEEIILKTARYEPDEEIVNLKDVKKTRAVVNLCPSNQDQAARRSG